MKTCQHCGKEANTEAKFCTYCGNKFPIPLITNVFGAVLLVGGLTLLLARQELTKMIVGRDVALKEFLFGGHSIQNTQLAVMVVGVVCMVAGLVILVGNLV